MSGIPEVDCKQPHIYSPDLLPHKDVGNMRTKAPSCASRYLTVYERYWIISA